MKSVVLTIEGKKATGLEVELPKAPLVMVSGEGGFVMCGYLNMETAEKLGVAAARVRGVNTVDDLLNAKVESCTQAAERKGVALGMSGREALARLL